MAVSFGILIICIVFVLPIYSFYNILTLKEDIKGIKNSQKKLQDKISSLEHSMQRKIKQEAYEKQNETEVKKVEIKEEVKKPELKEEIKQDEFNIQKELDKLDKIYKSEKFQANKEVPSQTSGDFEKLFLGNVFNKIGAIALILGIGIFVKMVSQYIVITPEMQVFLAYLTSVLIILGGFYMHKKSSKKYGEILTGVGLAGFLISTYASVSFYKLISEPVAVLMGVLVVLFSYLTAQKFNTFSTIALGIFGAYFNLFFVNNDLVMGFLFTYLIFINLMSIVYVNQHPDKIALNMANLFLSTFAVTILSLSNKTGELTLFYPIILWLIYFVNDFMLIIKNKYSSSLETLNWLNFASLVWFVNYVFHFKDKLQIGLTLVVFAIIYIVAQILVIQFNNQNPKRIYTQNALLAILASTFFLTNGIIRPITYSIEAFILSYLYTKIDYKEFKHFSCANVCACALSILSLQDVLFSLNYRAFLNERLVLLGASSGFIALGAYLFSKRDKNISEIFNFTSLTFLYLYLIFEINSIYGTHYDKLFIDIVVCSIYALNMNNLFKKTQNALFKHSSSLIYALAVILMFYAISQGSDINIPFINIRFGAFLALILSGIILSKQKEIDFLKYLSTLFGAMSIYLETCELAKLIYSENIAVLGSVGLILYGGIIILFGIFKNIKWIKTIGIWIILFSILKILFFDLSGIDAFFKLIAFVVLGCCLMVVSYYYSKISKEK